ncbi:tyrosine-type recombinase/integrase [Ruegeria sp. Ofav3-42]|uniref:tyrosine-type recombinase/integrase n=1 Tax=Ruegeria sp. Ofav3-42 TaxID=2917759 RepID=UPI001EF4DCA8|nr:tyrosine-type recombinase/integrase [Ruegeria sp. Ofav3-42]MCG7522244.1 site-specific integrase [Ruegeria sp. Ofav3-42]
MPDDIPEDHPDFLAAYLNAENQNGPKPQRGATPSAGTVAHAWWRFTKSDDFLELSDGYRSRMIAHGEAITQTGGKVPINQIRAYHIENDIADLDRAAARTRLKTWRKFLKWAHPKLIEKNWAMHVDMPKAKKGERHKRWADEHIKAFRAKWAVDTPQRLAMELMLFTGMRICDAVRCGPGWVDKDGWMAFKQQKTKGDVLIAFDRALPAFADAEALQHLNKCLEARTEKHMTWLATVHGTSRSEKAASNWFSDAARKAGLKDEARRTAHGLRDTCCARLAENGATSHQIMTWSGHETLDEAERYTKEADKKRMLSVDDSGTEIVQVANT